MKKLKVILIIFGVLLFLTGLAAGTFLGLRYSGKKRLQEKAEGGAPKLAVSEGIAEEPDEEELVIWQPGWVKKDGKILAYNEDMITFLIMGIDKKGDAKDVGEGLNGGQADALFLLALDPHKEKMSVVAINRNTMTDIDFYDTNGQFEKTATAQIAVQHGFGNGVEESCERQVKAVRTLFYDLPIHGYAALNMSAIGTINDLLGGVDVTVLEDLTKADKRLKEGETVHLDGKAAFVYVKWRDTDEFGSADMRLARERQYLNSLLKKLRVEAKKNIGIISDLYKAVEPEMTTDLTLDEIMYLAPEITDYTFDNESLYSMKGETVMGEEFEEFYPDEEALYNMILDIFYEEIEQ